MRAGEHGRAGGYTDRESGSYVYFFLEAIRRLRFNGRLVFIAPTEFLDVRYGAPLKTALLNWCDIDELIVLEMDELGQARPGTMRNDRERLSARFDQAVSNLTQMSDLR